MPPQQLQAELFFFAATKIRFGRRRSLPLRPQQAKLFFFAATKIRIGRRRSLPLRTHQAKLFFFAAKKIRIGRRRSLPLRNHQAKPFSPASIRKSGPEIKNHCPLEDVSGGKLAAIAKFTPSNQESLHAGGRFQAKTCSDS